eukprot:c6854_g1_i1.p2 GENE.c6854_g1_i1~~c6854_g1_i1.p2  ORF type:complete len:351 (+),score=112.69 c6854_g1_i1:66-1118(+)
MDQDLVTKKDSGSGSDWGDFATDNKGSESNFDDNSNNNNNNNVNNDEDNNSDSDPMHSGYEPLPLVGNTGFANLDDNSDDDDMNDHNNQYVAMQQGLDDEGGFQNWEHHIATRETQPVQSTAATASSCVHLEFADNPQEHADTTSNHKGPENRNWDLSTADTNVIKQAMASFQPPPGHWQAKPHFFVVILRTPPIEHTRMSHCNRMHAQLSLPLCPFPLLHNRVSTVSDADFAKMISSLKKHPNNSGSKDRETSNDPRQQQQQQFADTTLSAQRSLRLLQLSRKTTTTAAAVAPAATSTTSTSPNIRQLEDHSQNKNTDLSNNGVKFDGLDHFGDEDLFRDVLSHLDNHD